MSANRGVNRAHGPCVRPDGVHLPVPGGPRTTVPFFLRRRSAVGGAGKDGGDVETGLNWAPPSPIANRAD